MTKIEAQQPDEARIESCPRISLVQRVGLLTTVMLLVASGADAAPLQGRILVKFKESLTQCAHCLLTQGQAFATALTDGSPDLDFVNSTVGASGGRCVFFDRHGMTTAQAQEALLDQVETVKARHPERTRRIPPNAPAPDLNLVNVYEIEIAPDVNPLEACAWYQADPHVEWCQPNYEIRTSASFVPNDHYYHSRSSFGQGYHDLWGTRQLFMHRAWATTQGEDVVVAVVDTGADAFHSDLSANVWVNPLELPNGIDDDGNGQVDDFFGYHFANSDSLPIDDNGHGTHVAGTIAAVGNNNNGIIGIAPKAKVMAVKAFDENGSGDFGLLATALKYATDTGAGVINNSWGCNGRCFSMPVVEEAVAYASRLGAVVVFSAGNSADDVFYYSPQNMTGADSKPIVVAATDPRRREAVFTNHGATVDVAAPGSGHANDPRVPFESLRTILSLKASGCDPSTIGSTCPPGLLVGSNYLRQAGTSMAAPHVAGAAALVLACNDTMENREVRHVLQASGRKRRSDGRIGNELINPYKALAYTTGVPDARITYPDRPPGSLRSVRRSDTLFVQGRVAGATVHSWQLFGAAGTASERRDYVLIAEGVGEAEGVLGHWNLQGQLPGEKTLILEVRARLPRTPVRSSVYGCGEIRPVSNYRTHFLREVQYFSVESADELDLQRVTSDAAKRYASLHARSGERIDVSHTTRRVDLEPTTDCRT